MPDLIPPRWLRPRRTVEGQADFPLPLALRLKVRRRGYAFVLALEAGNVTVRGVFRDASGQPLGPAVLEAPAAGVFVPQGAASLSFPAEGSGLRVGYYPRSKLGLKLHAFFNGTFSGAPMGKRWRTAGAAARDLRGTHGALIQAGPAHRQEQAAAYRRYRARFVEDFAEVPPADAAPLLSFVSRVSAIADLGPALDALARQTDRQWEWLVLVPETERAAASALLDGQTRARLLPATGDDPAEDFNRACAQAKGALIAPLDPAGRLTRDAVAMIRAGFAAHPDCRLLYADEERLDTDGMPVEGIFKPAFNRHLLRSLDYIGQPWAVRADRLMEIGGARAGFGAAWSYDLLLRAADPLPSAAIRHVPRVAYSRTAGMGDGTFAGPAVEAAQRALREAAGVAEVQASEGRLRPLYPLPATPPLVSFVIPTRDRADLLGLALRSMIALTAYRNFEIVVVDNGSVEPETFTLFEDISRIWPATKIVRDDGNFNYPRICNRGVDAASGSLICLLNNDIEVVEPGWLDEMVALASLPQTGVVGAKLLFPDRTIQHAGVIAGLFAYAGHWFAHAAADADGYQGRLHSRQNLSAVTGACLMIRRDCWDAIGPLDAERFAEDCNDIDLCLRAVAAGHELVWTPFACLIHHESASRGKRRAKAHRERLKAQRARFEARWHASRLVDPHYNPNLRRKSLYATLAAEPDGSRGARTCLVPPPEA
ncbi:glycosyltransferase family 2 protein [Azorhizobium doebereinerae]|uniref:glycosyltransferase family 2 protein n=1 Tax=Azorhizobium doebereinerae TaxID=281091 RepID=UPI0003F75B84|nr:glycosyltransferase family 2 protein [Azorhizobium doebereinerae]